MSTRVQLPRALFTERETEIVCTDNQQVTAWRYETGVEALRVSGSSGQIVVLPFMGQMIWQATLGGVDLTPPSMFPVPRPATVITETYGCFAFHSGLLSNGCPGPDDDHPLHGEMPCAAMDSAWLQLDERGIAVGGVREYAEGFGPRYEARPGVTLLRDEAALEITMSVTNLSAGRPMPLQYMCHINHAFVPGATLDDSLAPDAWTVRTSVPDHVHPTPEWEATVAAMADGNRPLDRLDDPALFDPEIVVFADHLPAGEQTLSMTAPDGTRRWTRFDASEFPTVTRWFLHDPDLQVAAYALPATCRPEGRAAAAAAGTLVHLEPGHTRSFSVTTGVERAGA